MKNSCICVVVFFVLVVVQAFASDYPLTDKRFALGAITVCANNETLQNKEGFDIYVFGNYVVAEEFEIFRNQSIGKVKLNSIVAGNIFPKVCPDVIIVCDESKTCELVDYCRMNNVFSISRSSVCCENGLSTAIVSTIPSFQENEYSLSSVYVKINKHAVFSEGFKFYPEIMRFAVPVEESEYGKNIVLLQLF